MSVMKAEMKYCYLQTKEFTYPKEHQIRITIYPRVRLREPKPWGGCAVYRQSSQLDSSTGQGGVL